MVIRGELALVLVAIALTLITIASVLSPRLARLRSPLAAVGCAMAGLAPLLSYPFVDPARADGRALWEWSAAGGPTIQASYRFDGLAAIGLAIGVLYGGAALIATTRVSSRSSILRPALLLNAFILMTLTVTDDLVAVTVVLGALAANTIFVSLLVSPPAAVARVTAYLAGGVQAFVVAALLVTRFGGASFRFFELPPTTITPGVVLAATIGAALIAGLYPFVPWGYRQDESGERESLRGLLTMPAGVGATIVLLRIVGATRLDLATLRLPGVIPDQLLVLSAILFLLATWRSYRAGPRGRARAVVLTAAVLLLFVLYPVLHWSHLVVVACALTIAYAAAVSLALPDQWTVTRYDVTLAVAWIGIACGTPTAVAGGLIVLLGGALAALVDAFWMPPHRVYIAMLASTTTIIAGALGVAVGALGTPDALTFLLALLAIGFAVALELVHVGRRLDVAAAPPELEIAATVVAFLVTTLVLFVAGAPLVDALARGFGRPMDQSLRSAAFIAIVCAALAAMFAVIAGAVRPLLPDLAPLGTRISRVVALADPVPVAVLAFRALERSATAVSTVFALFEQRAGVWLALVLIVGVLFWAVR
ncbi:MAG TPA: hypothetical protein VEU77_01635 [Candidatus Acidoferrales bacterium]|nr:hypothetical protein [Candidatus Acidoferrales bacterium]